MVCHIVHDIFIVKDAIQCNALCLVYAVMCLRFFLSSPTLSIRFKWLQRVHIFHSCWMFCVVVVVAFLSAFRILLPNASFSLVSHWHCPMFLFVTRLFFYLLVDFCLLFSVHKKKSINEIALCYVSCIVNKCYFIKLKHVINIFHVLPTRLYYSKCHCYQMFSIDLEHKECIDFNFHFVTLIASNRKY